MNEAFANTGWLGEHPDEGELLAYADRGLAASERERVATHLVSCEHCQGELSGLQLASQSVTAALGSLGSVAVSDIRRQRALAAVREASARASGRGRRVSYPWHRLAAAAALVVMTGVLAGPGLALVRAVFGGSGRGVAVELSPVVVSELESVDAPRLHLEWGAPQFVLAFERLGDGVLEFRRQGGRSATVQVEGARPSVTTGPDRVLIGNASGAARYVVTLPPHVTGVTVSVAGGVQLTLRPQPGVQYDLRELAAGRLVAVSGR